MIIHPLPLTVICQNRELFTCTLELLIRRSMRELVDGSVRAQRALEAAKLDESVREAICDMATDLGHPTKPDEVLRPRAFFGQGFASIMFDQVLEPKQPPRLFEIKLDYAAPF